VDPGMTPKTQLSRSNHSIPLPSGVSALRASGAPSGRSSTGSQNPASHSAKLDAAGSPRHSAA
jgi:hypothetical protein